MRLKKKALTLFIHLADLAVFVPITQATETGPWRTSTYPVDEADMKEETEENENIGPGPVQVELQQPVQDVDNPEEIVQVEFATRPRWQL